MAQFTIPNLPPTTDVEALRQALAQAFTKLVGQLNGQGNQLDGQGQRVVNVATPTSLFDAVNKLYLDQKLEDTQYSGVSAPNSGATPFVVLREGYGVVTFDSLFPTSDRDATFFVPSIDETDIGWRGTGTLNGTATSFTATVTGTSRYGRRIGSITVSTAGSGYTNPQLVISGTGSGGFGTVQSSGGAITGVTVTNPGLYTTATSSITGGTGTGAVLVTNLADFVAGDYILWNHPSNYEINRIKSISGSTYTLYSVNGTRTPYFGSVLATHTGKTFYRVVPSIFQDKVKAIPTEKLEFIHANKCMLAANSPFNNPKGFVNLNHSADSVPAPGLRTMNGAAYHIGISTSTITTNQQADFPIKVQAWESIRFVYGYCGIAPTGASLNVDVIYINGSTTGLIDKFSIGTGGTVSYANPDGLNMPAHSGWSPSTEGQYDWPPNLLPNYGVGPAIQFAPDGYIDLVVTQVGTTTAGGKLIAVIQT